MQTVIIGIIGILGALGGVWASTNSNLVLGADPRILTGRQGGTGLGSATAGDVSKCLKVLDDSPFTYELGTCGSGGGADYPFTPTTISGLLYQATSSRLMAPQSLWASSTVGILTTGTLTATTTVSIESASNAITFTASDGSILQSSSPGQGGVYLEGDAGGGYFWIQTDGDVEIQHNDFFRILDSVTNTSAFLKHSNLSVDRTYQFPDWNGQFAVSTSTLQVSAINATSTSKTATSTFNGPVDFTATSVASDVPSVVVQGTLAASFVHNYNEQHLYVETANGLDGNAPGNLYLFGGDDMSENNDGAEVQLYAGEGVNGGAAQIQAGGAISNGQGGIVYITGGTGRGAGNFAGDIRFTTGSGLSGAQAGNMYFDPASSGGYGHIYFDRFSRGRIGVGTGSPTAFFHVSTTTPGWNLFKLTAGSNNVVYDKNGYFGIGSSTPDSILSIGNANASTTISMGKIQWEGQNNTGAVICTFFVGTTLTTISGPCNQ